MLHRMLTDEFLTRWLSIAILVTTIPAGITVTKTTTDIQRDNLLLAMIFPAKILSEPESPFSVLQSACHTRMKNTGKKNGS